MKLSILIFVFLGVVSCTPPLATTGQVNITASSTTIKVGEQATLTFELIPGVVDPTVTPAVGKYYGNLYLGNIGNRPFDNPRIDNKKDFPVPSQIKMIVPVTGTDNVPPLNLINAQTQNGHMTATFVIEGASEGVAALGGDFVFIPDADPAYFSRFEETSGKIFITVLPK